MSNLTRFISLVLLCVAAAFYFSGCGSDTSSEALETPATGPVTTTETTEYSPLTAQQVGASLGGSNALPMKYDANLMNWGTSYNSVSGILDPTIVCVDVANTGFSYDASNDDSHWRPGTASVTTSVRVTSSSSDFASVLSINQHAKLGVGSFKGSESARMTSSAKFSKNRVYGSWRSVATGMSKSLDPTRLTIRDAILGQFDNFLDFTNYCGDYYLFEMQTGAEMSMFLEIVSNDSSSADTIKTKLDTEFGKMASGGAGVNSDFDKAYKASTVTKKIGMEAAVDCDFSIPKDDSLTAFNDALTAFSKNTKNCIGLNSGASETAASKGLYFKWDKELWSRQRRDWVLANMCSPNCATNADGDNYARVVAMNNISTAYDNYQELLGEIDNMKSNPTEYDWSSTTHTPDTVGNEKKKIEDLVDGTITQLKKLASECEFKPEQCAGDTTQIHPTFKEISKLLPNRKLVFPVSCLAYKKNSDPNTPLSDGLRQLYFNGDSTKPMCVYCYGMTGDSPKDYLKLTNTSVAGDRTYNYSAIINTWTTKTKDKKTTKIKQADLVSTFNYLPIIIRQKAISIDRGNACNENKANDGYNTAFNENWFSVAVDPVKPYDNWCSPYGHGIVGIENTSTLPEPLVNVDLTGLPFAIATSNEIKLSGTKWATGSWTPKPLDSKSQSVTISVLGNPAGIAEISDFHYPSELALLYDRSLDPNGGLCPR